MPSSQCGECKKFFSKIGNLRAHVKRKHPDKLNILAPKKTYITAATCSKCNNTFVNTSNLNAHIRTKHPDLNKTQCEICKSENKSSSAYCVHIKNHKNSKKLNCGLCRLYSDSSKANLLEHYKETHDVKLDYEELVFPLFEKFLSWKQTVEKETHASFVTMHGSSKSKSHTLIRYSCHRSGEFKSKGNNKRKLKKQGSNKIDAFCPASMKVTIKSDCCEVVFQKIHVGHKLELNRLFLTPEEREKIASEIEAKMPYDAILERVRKSDLPRLHLLTKQDLYNIQNRLPLKTNVVRHSDCDLNTEDCLNEAEENVTESDLFIDTDHTEIHPPASIVQCETTESAVQLFLDRKKQVLEEMTDICKCVSSPEELKIIEDSLASIRTSLQKLQSQSTLSTRGVDENRETSVELQLPSTREIAKNQCHDTVSIVSSNNVLVLKLNLKNV